MRRAKPSSVFLRKPPTILEKAQKYISKKAKNIQKASGDIQKSFKKKLGIKGTSAARDVFGYDEGSIAGKIQKNIGELKDKAESIPKNLKNTSAQLKEAVFNKGNAFKENIKDVGKNLKNKVYEGTKSLKKNIEKTKDTLQNAYQGRVKAKELKNFHAQQQKNLDEFVKENPVKEDAPLIQKRKPQEVNLRNRFDVEQKQEILSSPEDIQKTKALEEYHNAQQERFKNFWESDEAERASSLLDKPVSNSNIVKNKLSKWYNSLKDNAKEGASSIRRKFDSLFNLSSSEQQLNEGDVSSSIVNKRLDELNPEVKAGMKTDLLKNQNPIERQNLLESYAADDPFENYVQNPVNLEDNIPLGRQLFKDSGQSLNTLGAKKLENVDFESMFGNQQNTLLKRPIIENLLQNSNLNQVQKGELIDSLVQLNREHGFSNLDELLNYTGKEPNKLIGNMKSGNFVLGKGLNGELGIESILDQVRNEAVNLSPHQQ